MEEAKLNLCRICLESGANLPLFEDMKDDKCDIQIKLSLCFKEKIQDIEGYPRNICQTCNNILDETYIFINKFKETCRILKSGLDNLKSENVHDYSDNGHSEPEIEIDNIKNEYDSDDNDFSNENLVLEPMKLELKLEKIGTTLKKKRNYKTNTRQITSKVASSILEGEFAWNGDKWCINTNSKRTLRQLPKPLSKIKTEKRKRITIKIPKTKKPNPPKLCDLCGKVFNSQDKLSTHKKRIHFRNPVKCSLCPRLLSSDYYLSRHMKRTHEGEKKFVCSVCGRGFAFKGELGSHVKTVHEKHLAPKKQFQCQFCNKTYKCAKSVVIHERSAHTGQRPAVCTVCGSSFYHEDYLKEHMRLHTGDTPFKCPICGRGYAQRCNMKSHLRIHKVSELDAATLSKLRPNYLRLLKA